MRTWTHRLAGLGLWGALLLWIGPTGCSPAATGEQGGTANEAEAAPALDLDRTLEDLLAASCEHGIPQYTCDECRYQVGMARAEGALFGAGQPMDTLIVTRRAVSRSLELDGEVELDESRSVRVAPRSPGIVRAIHVDLGSRVRAGETLFEVECADFTEAKAGFRRSHAARELAQATWERERDLFERKICPEKELLEARAALAGATADERAARERLLGYGLAPDALEALPDAAPDDAAGLLPVRAPFAGTILERSLNLGAAVEPGRACLLLGDTARLWVITSVYERELALLTEAQTRAPLDAEVTVPAYPGRVFAGRVDRLQGTLDEATRTVKVRVLVDNPEGVLRAGMFARVRLLPPGLEEAIAVPADAVLEDAGRSFVFLRAVAPYFVRRPVTTGRAWPGWVEVTEGLAGGETLVTRGAFLLKSDVLRSKMGAGCAD